MTASIYFRDVREAGKGVAASLYGETAQISELQLLFSLTELHRMQKDFEKFTEPNIFHEIDVGKSRFSF